MTFRKKKNVTRCASNSRLNGRECSAEPEPAASHSGTRYILLWRADGRFLRYSHEQTRIWYANRACALSALGVLPPGTPWVLGSTAGRRT